MKAGNLVHHLPVHLGNQPADDHRFLVGHGDRGLGLPLGDDGHVEIVQKAVLAVLDGLLDLQGHELLLGDAGRDVESDADILVGEVGQSEIRCLIAGNISLGKRHHLAYGDHGLFVVQRQDAGGGDDVEIAVVAVGLDDAANLGVLVDVVVASPVDLVQVELALDDAKGQALAGKGRAFHSVVGESESPEPAVGGIHVSPLDSQLLRRVCPHLGDKRLHQHLGPEHVELLQQHLYLVVHVRRRVYQKRVEGRLHHRFHLGGGLVLRLLHGIKLVDGLGDGGGVGVLQTVDVHVRLSLHLLPVQALDDAFNFFHQGYGGRADHHRPQAHIGDQARIGHKHGGRSLERIPSQTAELGDLLDNCLLVGECKRYYPDVTRRQTVDVQTVDQFLHYFMLGRTGHHHQDIHTLGG